MAELKTYATSMTDEPVVSTSVDFINDDEGTPKGPYEKFVTLELADSGAAGSGSDQASVALALCKRYIVLPYNMLLIIIGWRKFQTERDSCPHVLRVLNVVYPVFIFAMLVFTCAAQVVTCFSRTQSTRPQVLNDSYAILQCDHHLVTLDVIPYLMILGAYVLSFYTFRIAEPERLSSLAETVFLSYNEVGRSKSRRTPVLILLSVLFCGLGFFVFSIIVSVTRLFALGLHEDSTIIAWFTSDPALPDQQEALKLYGAVKNTLVVFSLFGFLFFDLLFIAVTINYCSQCQLLTFYIDNIQDKVRNKKYGNLSLAMKEIRQINTFLKVLNGNIALVAGLIFLIFVSNAILSYIELTEDVMETLNIVTGFLNTIQWVVAAIFPALFAARLTSSCNELRRLGQEIAARPFYYADTPDLELQFFLTFTSSTRYQVRLLYIPMQPSIVLGTGFILLLCIASGVLIPQVKGHVTIASHTFNEYLYFKAPPNILHTVYFVLDFFDMDEEASDYTLGDSSIDSQSLVKLQSSIQFSNFSSGDEENPSITAFTSRSEFVTVENTADVMHLDPASATLAQCKRFVVGPYNILLKVIGWRKFQNHRDRCPAFYKCLNICYPILMYCMLMFACFAQVITCFSRTKSVPTDRVSDTYYVLTCSQHFVSSDIVSYLMILVAYPLALYMFRVTEPEHLATLAETVFLSFSDVISTRSRRKPFFILVSILAYGIAFFMTSAGISILRMFALRLDDDTTIISWFTSDPKSPNQSEVLKMDTNAYTFVHYSLVICAYFGFLFFDLLYIAVTINYCSQCQLLTFYIENIQDKVRNKKYDNLNLAMKEINQVYNFLKILNGKVTTVTSLIFFIFVSNVILSYTDLIKPGSETINIATGFLNTLQWLAAVIFPVIMAARLTSSGNELRRLGQEIAARPFYYADTPDLELQFFLTYTSSTRYQVHLAFIPMQPSFVLGVGFLLLLCFNSGTIIPEVESVTWF